VMLTRAAGKPHLATSHTGSNARAADLYWRWPPDLDLVVRGTAPARPAASVLPPRAATTMELDLLAQIAANPKDDDVRRVYADLLAERDSSRGEFITLQLATELDAAAGRRMRELERTHRRDWLGPLGALAAETEFERGFLARCTLGGPTTPFDAWAAALEPRARYELATCRALELSDNFPEAIAGELLAASNLPWLERLSIGEALVETLRRRVETLEIRSDRGPAAAAAVASTAVARLAPGELRIQVVDAIHFTAVLAAALPLAWTRPRSMQRFVVGSKRYEVVVTRDERDALSIITATAEAGHVRALVGRALPVALRGCAADRVTKVVVRAGEVNPAQLRALRQACAQLSAAVVIE
jgi:uncharacterized protein (TIGR02996 family)